MQTTQKSAWEFGVGFGYGKRTNPLLGGDDLDLPYFVNISYFAERFFFDNGDLGWNLKQAEDYTLNLVFGLNSERAYFSGLDQLGFVLGTPELGYTDGAFINPNDTDIAASLQLAVSPPRRDRPVDGGLEWSIEHDSGLWFGQLLSDVSNQHQGHEFYLKYSLPFTADTWSGEVFAGLVYKSARWTNYFYGVTLDEQLLHPVTAQAIRPAYTANSAVNLFYGLRWRYQLNQHWHWLLALELEMLDSAIADSPIVKDKRVSTWFSGFYYAF